MVRRLMFAAAALLPLSGAAPLAAQDFFFQNVCGVADNTSLKICASADLTLSGTTLRMRVWNMEVAGGSGTASYYSEFGGWHTITSVGLQYMGSGASGSGDFTQARYVFGGGANDYLTLSSWRGIEDRGGRNPLQVELGSSTNGNREGIVGCTDPGPSNQDHVKTCGAYGYLPYVEFTFEDVDPNINFALYNFEFHGQQMTGGRSAKGSGPGTPPGEVVPEPITMVLLGSGLLGIGGVSLRRKRREETDAEV